MKNVLTNIRTYLQFSKGQRVFNIVFNGNKLMAMNSIKLSYGVKSLSTITEYKEDGYLVEGTYSEVNQFTLKPEPKIIGWFYGKNGDVKNVFAPFIA